MVRNATVKSEKKTTTIKVAVQTASGSLNPKKITVILVGNPSTQMDGSGSSFKYEESNSMEAEAMEEYALASAEADYEDQGK